MSEEILCPANFLIEECEDLFEDSTDLLYFLSVKQKLLQKSKEINKIKPRKCVIWHINSTPQGGSVAETLQSLISNFNQIGIESHWLVINAEESFFKVTKRIQNGLVYSSGDSGYLSASEKKVFDQVNAENLASILERIHPEDICVLHDPQTAGLIPGLHHAGIRCIWSFHGSSPRTDDQFYERSWSFLRDYVSLADFFIFPVLTLAPSWIPTQRIGIVPPAIDVFCPKNQPMSENNAIKICYHIGLIRLEPKTRISKHDLAFIRMNGSIGYIERHADILHSGPLPIASDRMILHISRWDKLRDMVGIMQAFAQFVSNEFPDAYLVFAGPNVHSIQDDPEMVEAYQEIVNAWHRIPKSVRKRIQIACLPMKDREESAAIVNALERHATVICNKSLRQSLGLSVIEALWKHKPVVSSNFEGLSELMTDEDTRELFLQYPTDLTEFANHLIRTISDDQYRRNLCEFGYIHVRDSFSTFNTMSSYLEAFQTTLNLY